MTPALLREPLQERSRRTTERILDALEALLKEKPFEAITVRELLARASTSAGSFYARFPTREALLPVLYDRHDEQLRAGEWTRDAPDLESFASLAELTRDMTRSMVVRHRERRWFIRAVALHARLHPELIPEEQRVRRQAVHARWHARILRFRAEIRHPEPDTAVPFALFMIVSTCREKVVFADAPLATSFILSDERLAEELAWAFLSFLGVSTENGR